MQAAAEAWLARYEEASRVIAPAVDQARQNSAHLLVSSLFFQGRLLGNHGRVPDALCSLKEGMRIAEADRLSVAHYATVPNTLAWLYSEIQHFDLAIKLNEDGVQLGRESGFPEAAAYSQLNLGRVYLILADLDRALEYLCRSQQMIKDTSGAVCFRWLLNVHLQSALAEYWISRGKSGEAAVCAEGALSLAQAAQARKQIAWTHKLLGDIAMLEDRLPDASRQFARALKVLRNYPCPLIEWKILRAAAKVAAHQRRLSNAELYRRRGRLVVESLASSITDEALRRTFLSSKAVRDL